MKVFITFAVFFIVQGVLIHSTTIEEVVQDFQPIFDKLHADIAKIEASSKQEEDREIEKFQNSVSNEKYESLKYTTDILKEITDYIVAALDHYGQSQESVTVRHCVLNQRQETNFLIVESEGERNVCDKLSTKSTEKVKESFVPFNEYLASLHREVEYVRDICSVSQTPQDMHVCLTEQLYDVIKPKIADMETRLKYMAQSNEEVLDKEFSTIDYCFQIVHDEVTKKRSTITTDFVQCVWKATN